MSRKTLSRLIITLALSAVLLITVLAPHSVGDAVSTDYESMVGGASPLMCALAVVATAAACAQFNVPLCAFGIAYLATEC